MISIKDIFKMISIAIVIACSTFVCTIFLNYNIDLVSIKHLITKENESLYNAILNSGIITSVIAGSCLVLTAIILLVFYIKNFIDSHMKELGILKCLGYSNKTLSMKFYVFGITTLIGSIVGHIIGLIYLNRFYELQNKDGYLPFFEVKIHPLLSFSLIFFPTILFVLLSIIFARLSLRQNALNMIKENKNAAYDKKIKDKDEDFLKTIKRQVYRNKSLLFFIILSSFCFSSMIQMSFSMKELSSKEMGLIILIIGLLIAILSLILSLETVIKKNSKTISLLKAFGYSNHECSKSILNVYRPFSFVGFICGTIYQYALLKFMVDVVFANANLTNINYSFDWIVFLGTFIAFIIFYEGVMLYYKNRIMKLPVKIVMQE